jgi:YhcH/YjgK/YiaL family protein
MIYDTLKNFGRYFHSTGSLFRALSFAAAFDPTRPDGRYEIDSDRIFALVSSYETSPAAQNRFEVHRIYADVQVVLEGEEKIEVSPASGIITIGDYDETKDAAILEASGDSAALVMRPGYFAVLYPHEAHRPGSDLHGKSHVRKIVVKVRLEAGSGQTAQV